MKRIVFLFCTSLMCVLLACEKEVEDEFTYNFLSSSIHPADSSLFITYDIDSVNYKYYQIGFSGRNYYQPIPFPDSVTVLYYYERNISFGEMRENSTMPTIYGPSFFINFYNTKLYNKNSLGLAEFDYNKTNLSEELRLNYDYKILCPPSIPNLNDSIFMKDVCLNYTQNVMHAFNFNLSSINEFYSNKSHFTISNIKSVGRNYFLVTGDFETKGIDYKNDTIIFENGHFAFLTK